MTTSSSRRRPGRGPVTRRSPSLVLAPLVLAALAGGACASPAADGPSPGSPSTAASGGVVTPLSTPAPTPTPTPSGRARITYRYGDSSVPPPYHRSQELTVTRDRAVLTIDSYGDVLARRSVRTPPAVWRRLRDGLPDVLALKPQSPEGGCAGGTTRQVVVRSGGKTVGQVAIDVCGGVDARSAAAVDAWIRPARDLFPPTEELAPLG